MALEYRGLLSRSLLIGLMVAAVALSGCGRKGPLEPPPSAALKTTSAEGTATTTDAAPQKPNRPFALDPLIQ